MKTLNLLTIGLTLIPTVVLADFKSDIISSCTAYQEGSDKSEINACKLYIDGFIDSSILSEDATVKPKATINKESSQQSAFMERAYRTRVFNSPSSLPTEITYKFCIPSEYDRKYVASSVAKQLNIDNLNEKPLKVVLFDALVSRFPCKK